MHVAACLCVCPRDRYSTCSPLQFWSHRISQNTPRFCTYSGRTSSCCMSACPTPYLDTLLVPSHIRNAFLHYCIPLIFFSFLFSSLLLFTSSLLFSLLFFSLFSFFLLFSFRFLFLLSLSFLFISLSLSFLFSLSLSFFLFCFL